MKHLVMLFKHDLPQKRDILRTFAPSTTSGSIVNCEDTRPGHQLEASNKQHESLKRLKAKKLHFTPSFLVWEDQSIPLTLCII